MSCSPHCQSCLKPKPVSNISKPTLSTMALTFGKIVTPTQIVSIVHYPNATGKQMSRELLQHVVISQARRLLMMLLLSRICFCRVISVAIHSDFAGLNMITRRNRLSCFSRIKLILCHQIISVHTICKITVIRLSDMLWKSISWKLKMTTRLNMNQMSLCSRSISTLLRPRKRSQLSPSISIPMSIFINKLKTALCQEVSWSSTPQKLPSAGSTSKVEPLQ